MAKKTIDNTSAGSPFPITDHLPDEYLKLIGEVMVLWGLQELALRRTVYAMLDLSEAQGRTAVRTPRAKEMVLMIGELALIEEFTIDLKSLDSLDLVEGRRNLLAHGIWFCDDGKFYLQDLQGTWPRDQGQPGVKKRILPAGIPITVSSLQDLAQAIRTTTQNTYVVAQAIQERRT